MVKKNFSFRIHAKRLRGQKLSRGDGGSPRLTPPTQCVTEAPGVKMEYVLMAHKGTGRFVSLQLTLSGP